MSVSVCVTRPLGASQIQTAVPRLLSDKLIQQCRERAAENRTRKDTKHTYILSGFVYCGTCGYRLTPQPHREHGLRFRHATRNGAQACPVRPRHWIRASELEDAVVDHLVAFYGNPKAVAAAAAKYTPNTSKGAELAKEQASLEEKLAKLKVVRARHQASLDRDLVDVEEVFAKLKDLREREKKVEEQLAAMHKSMINLPTPKQIDEAAKQVAIRMMKRMAATQRAKDPRRMTDEQKRLLVEDVFSGKRPDGKPNGVYITSEGGQVHHKHKIWKYELHGNAAIDGHKGKTRDGSYVYDDNDVGCVRQSEQC